MGKYGEKLPATAARDLINYTKLLKELMEAADRMKAEQDAAKKKAPMSTEQLEQLARDVTGAPSSSPAKAPTSSPRPPAAPDIDKAAVAHLEANRGLYEDLAIQEEKDKP